MRLFQFFENAALMLTDFEDLIPIFVSCRWGDFGQVAIGPHELNVFVDGFQATSGLEQVVRVELCTALVDLSSHIEHRIPVGVLSPDADR